jgi:hypothetical protein
MVVVSCCAASGRSFEESRDNFEVDAPALKLYHEADWIGLAVRGRAAAATTACIHVL